MTVTASGGTAIIGHFYYRRLPVVNQLSFSSGSTNGGNVVTLTGLRFIGVKYVWFGAVQAAATVRSDTELTVTVPPSALARTVPVYTVNAGGVSNSLAYTYVGGPTITSISPASGPRTGSRIVNINGTFLSQVTTITFGGIPALSFKVMSAVKVQAVTPPKSTPGPVAVVVQTSTGATASSPSRTRTPDSSRPSGLGARQSRRHGSSAPGAAPTAFTKLRWPSRVWRPPPRHSSPAATPSPDPQPHDNGTGLNQEGLTP